MNCFPIKLVLILCYIKLSQSFSNIYIQINNNLNYLLIIDDSDIYGKPFNISLKPYQISINKRVQQLNNKCLFYGEISSPLNVNAIISLSNCTNIAFGILSVDGETYVINHYGNASHNRRAKRELNERQMKLIKQNNVGVCGNALREPTPEWFIKNIESTEPKDDIFAQFGDGMVELAVYVDRLMLSYHNNDYDMLNQYVVISVAYVQTVLHQSNIEKHITLNLTIKHYEMIEIDDIYRYSINEILRNFCGHHFVNRTAADISLLFSGANMWYTPQGQVTSTVLGLANVYSVCKSRMNCLVLEGRNLKSPMTLAHEIGHMFGMFHDGDDKRSTADCHNDRYIMSPTISGGKTQWSECSVRQMRKFFLSFKRDNNGRIKCFQQKPLSFNPHYDIDNLKALRPGLSIDIHRQCQMSFGPGFYSFIDRNTQNICRLMYCWSKLVVVSSGPALEGTKCGINRYCKLGHCLPGKY